MTILPKYNVLNHCHRAAADLKWLMKGATNRVFTQEPVVALAFADGPIPASTPALLAALEKFQARATFFICDVDAGHLSGDSRPVVHSGQG